MVKKNRDDDRVQGHELDRIGAGGDVQSGKIPHIIKNFFLSDLSKTLRNGFHSSFSISSASLNEGIVLPI
jgi:hypothetical protein